MHPVAYISISGNPTLKNAWLFHHQKALINKRRHKIAGCSKGNSNEYRHIATVQFFLITKDCLLI